MCFLDRSFGQTPLMLAAALGNLRVASYNTGLMILGQRLNSVRLRLNIFYLGCSSPNVFVISIIISLFGL